MDVLFQTAENLRIRGLADVDTGDDDAASEQHHTASSYTPSKFAGNSRSPSKIGRTTPNNNVSSEKASSSSKVDRFSQPSTQFLRQCFPKDTFVRLPGERIIIG